MIKNLLFDLGGVIMDIKRDNCVAAFKELGMKNTRLSIWESMCRPVRSPELRTVR